MLRSSPLVRAVLAAATLLCLLATAAPQALAGAKKKKFTTTVRIFPEANSMDGEQFAAPVRIPYPPYQIHISKLPIITELEIDGFRSYPQEDGTYGALFYLSRRGQIALETVSLERPRTYLYVVINGRPLFPVFIDRPARDGKFYVKSGLQALDLKLFSENFKMANKAEEMSRIQEAHGQLEEGRQREEERSGKPAKKQKKKKGADPAPEPYADSPLFLDGTDGDSLPVQSAD
jgi:hypothetical protein